MDIELKTLDENFCLRSAALIIKDNCLLLAKSDNYDCYYTVGGGIQAGETSEEAVLREVYEETGKHLEIDRLMFVQERFYQAKKEKHHEVVFFYLMKNEDSEILQGTVTDQKNEHLYWIPLERLEQITLVPPFLKKAVNRLPQGIKHIVSYE